MVTAEAALVLPAMVAVLGLLLWGVGAAAVQLRCGDAARVGARAVARGEPPDRVRELTLAVAPPGAHLAVAEEGDLRRVRVTARAPGPQGVPALPVRAEAVAYGTP